MKLIGNVIISYINSGNKNKLNKCLIVFSLDKNGSRIAFVKHHTANKIEFKLSNNINDIRTGFISEGKITIKLKVPEIYILISQINPNEMKIFLELLNKVYENKENGMNKMSAIVTNEDKELLQTNLTIEALKEFPTTKGYPANLHKLYIINIKLKKFDNRILRLESLSVLNLENLLIEELPKQIEKMKLSTLKIMKCKLKQFPEISIDSNLSMSLTILDLSENVLKWLSEDIWISFQKLRCVILNGNQLRALPAVGLEYLKSIQKLDIGNNNLSILPNGFISLASRLTSCDLTNTFCDSVRSLSHSHVRRSSIFQPSRLVDSAIVAMQRNVTFHSNLIFHRDFLPRHLWLQVMLSRFCHYCYIRVPPDCRRNWNNLLLLSSVAFPIDPSYINPVLYYVCRSCLQNETSASHE